MFSFLKIIQSKRTIHHVEEITVESEGMKSEDQAQTLMSYAGVFKPYEIHIEHLKQIESDQNERRQIGEDSVQSHPKRALPRG